MANYTYYGKITVDNTKVAETDAGFAVPIIGTYDGTGDEPDLRTMGNGGHIQNTDATGGASGALTVPADLTFRTTADMTIAGASLDFEIEKYDAATGEIVAWVQSGVIVDTDVDIYMVYGNSGVTTSQEDVTGTWDANFVGVWHLNEAMDGSVDEVKDSTSSAAHGQGFGTMAGQDVGQVGYGALFEASEGDLVKIKDAKKDLFVFATGGFTIEAWIKPSSVGVGGEAYAFAKRNAANDKGYVFYHNAATLNAYANDGGWQLAQAADVVTTDFQYIVFLRDGNTIKVYRNGVLGGTTDTVNVIQDAETQPHFGDDQTGAALSDITLDEIRASDTTRTTGYTTTAYNSQSSPSTFYSMGSEQEPEPVVEGSFTADAVLKGAQASSFTADAVLEGTQADSFTADAWLATIYTLTADAVLKEAQASSLTADAVLKETQASSFTADGVLLQTTSGSFSADAVLKGTIASSFTADACLTTAAVSAKQPLFTKAGPVHIPVFPFQPISVAVSAAHTADYRGIIFCNATSGSLAVTLPDATGNLDKVYTIKHTSGSHDVQVVGTGGDTIDDETTQAISQYDAIKVISDNVEWWII